MFLKGDIWKVRFKVLPSMAEWMIVLVKPEATFFSLIGLKRDFIIRSGDDGECAVSDAYICCLGG